MKTSPPHIPEALTSPSLNRGTAFDAHQRHALGLTGRLPSAVLTLEDQAQRLWQQLQSLPTDLARNLLLEQVHNRNEVLYFKVLSEHLPELLPVVYDPTVGAAIECYSDEYRGRRGVYLSIDVPTRSRSPLTHWASDPTMSISSCAATPRRSWASAIGVSAVSRSPSASWRSTSPAPVSTRLARS